MKRLTILMLSVLLAGCSFTPDSNTTPAVTVVASQPTQPTMHQLQEMLASKIRFAKSQHLWHDKLPTAIRKLKKHVGKTWYVFGGSTPAGWDCSGLTMWFYKQLGYDLAHSATAQAQSGRYVKTPLPGDIVVWGGKGFAVHSAIYYGNGLAIHSGRAGTRTAFINVKANFFSNYQVRFVRVLPKEIKHVN